jgi:hypothetical protein
MQISLILAALETWAPIAVIVFVGLVYVLVSGWWPTTSERRAQLERFGRWLRAKQARSPLQLWLEIIALAFGTALVVVLIDYLLKR